MTVMPMVERELRVAARRRGTYWMRLAIALVGILIGVVIFVLTYGLPAEATGRHIFEWLSGLLFVYCLGYGRHATADCLSLEKREGTLGLLFLTDLNGLDVVLGKLAATSVRGFYGLLAVFPVLAIPILLGGITNGELWRVVLVLMDTFLFSLAIGMLGSAISRDLRRAMAANFILLLLFVAVPPACMIALLNFSPRIGEIPELLYSCPVYALYLCADAQYKAAGNGFWWSVALIHGLTWLLVLLAGRIVPHSWQDQPSRSEKTGWRELWRAWSYGAMAKQSAFRKRLLDANAFYWLAARARLKPVHVWTFLGCMVAWWLVGWAASGRLWLDSSVGVLTALLLNSTLKVWVVIEAGQQLAEDKRSGAFELLLSVPLTVPDILRGQLLALRRQFLKPLLVVLGVELIYLWANSLHSLEAGEAAIWLVGMLMLVVDVVALAWVAMWRALLARSHNFATISTLVRVLFLPWAVFGAVAAIGNLWSGLSLGREWMPGWKFYLGLWFGLGAVADLAFGLTAWWRLHTGFRELALRRFNPQPSGAAEWSSHQRSGQADPKPAVAAAQRGGTIPTAGRDVLGETKPHPKGIQRRTRYFLFFSSAQSAKTAVRILCCLALVTVCIGFMVLNRRPHFPPAVVVQLNQSNGPVRIFPGGNGVYFVLPDGSLWRWGQAGGARGTRVEMPERFGTNCDWVEASAAYTHSVGLRRDGTIWEWGPVMHVPDGGNPVQVGLGHEWASVSTSGSHSVALRRDGTLWAWGDNSMGQLGIGRGPAQTNLVQVGTNRDWVAVSCPWASTLGVRADGTLWAWGSVYVFGRGRATVNTYSSPTGVCLETNWAGLTTGIFPLVRTRSGELWEPFHGLPNTEASAASVLRLVLSNSVPGRFAAALCGQPRLYEVRPDGTLWGRTSSLGLWTGAANGNWQQEGKRSDWVSLWGAGGTALGLTSDGTIWTWGLDLGHEPVPDFLSRLKTIQGSLQGRFGTAAGPMNVRGTPLYQKQPRALMRLTSTNSP